MEDQKKPYEEVKVEIISFREEDVIRTSGGLMHDDTGIDWIP